MPEKSPRPVHAVDSSLCPLCGKSNQCAIELQRDTGVSQGPCWCTTAVFDQSLLARIPTQARRLACVCAHCAASASDGVPVPSTHFN